jgi:hypothetical protein
MRAGVRIGAAVCVALLAALPARAADKEAVQRAVDQGVAYLKGTQAPGGAWQYLDDPKMVGDATAGATSLCGLALLESGVPANDPAVEKAAGVVRQAAITLNQTYSLATAVMFLDRLGDPADGALIQSMAVRLLAGQDPLDGGWSYRCPPPNDAEVNRLQALLKQRNELVARPAPPEAPQSRPGKETLPKEIQQQLRLINQQAGASTRQATDNSNTQFAVLALWIARRKGIPVETAMRRIESRYRTTQQSDGGWGYYPPAEAESARVLWAAPATPAMTCAGLLGLALSHGHALEATLRTGAAGTGAPAQGGPARDLGMDPVIRKGLIALGSCIGKPLDQLGDPLSGKLPANGPAPGARPEGRGDPRNPNRGYYCLFSLERVAVAYDLETIGKKNWYDWGADVLVRSQSADGSWRGEFSQAGADTCFALLFLRRANLAQDLTATLKGRVLDPGSRDIKAVRFKDLPMGGDKVGALAAPPESGAAPKETRPPEAEVDPDVKRLSDELVKAEADRQDQVLEKLQTSKGAAYTDALAHAIHHLSGAVQGKARAALAERLTRMTAATLDAKLKDEDVEVRRAAALACAMKDERDRLPRLMEMLEDPELDVARAAHAALRNLTGKDFGPGKDAGRPDFSRAANAWKGWWKRTGGK